MVSGQNNEDLKSFLDLKYQQYNSFDFIKDDPIQIPHLFDKKEDIEISAFLTSIISWGNSAKKMMELLDFSPHEFIINSTKNEIKLFETNLDIAKKNLELNKSFLQPRLSAFYSYSTRIAYSDRLVGTGEFQNVPIGFVENTNQRVLTPVQKTRIIGAESFSEQFDRNAGQNFGLSLSIPILNNFSVRSNVDRSKVNILRNENQLLQKKLDLENTINQAHKDAQGAMKAFTASKKSLESRKLSYDYARDKFELGAMSSFDFTQVKQRFESAQSDLITSKFDLIFKIKVLEFYFGVPISID